MLVDRNFLSMTQQFHDSHTSCLIEHSLKFTCLPFCSLIYTDTARKYLHTCSKTGGEEELQVRLEVRLTLDVFCTWSRCD